MELENLIWPILSDGPLYWEGDILVDLTNGCRYHLDGSKDDTQSFPLGQFDSVKVSPSGRFQVLYQRVGTRGLVFENGLVSREIVRGDNFSASYDYPIEVFQLENGREVMAHCPDEYNVLQFEDLESGERLTKRKPIDFDYFHSRLQVSPNGRWLLNAGWFWHPWNTIALYDIEEVLKSPEVLDSNGMLHDDCIPEILGATFCGDHLILTGGDQNPLGPPKGVGFEVRPRTLAVVEVPSGRIKSEVSRTQELGTLLPVDEKHILSLYGHPKLVDLTSGNIVREWPDVFTGKQVSSIHWEALPPMAYEPKRRLLAVGGGGFVRVIDVSPGS